MRRFALVLCALVLPALPLAADTRLPGSAAELRLSFAPVVRAAAPAVVNIYARRVVARQVSPFADDPFFSQLFGTRTVPELQNSLGSGVILAPDGIVVSNYHVVGEATDIRVVLADRREFDARVILSDPDSDLAVLRLDGAADLPALQFADSDAVEVGDLVLAIGNPFGVGQTVTSGIVSGLARSGAAVMGRSGYFIQTDAPINPGNSGGALVDMAGRLVGINTSILTRSGGSNGIGFAIPANLVRQYVAQAAAGGTRPDRPWAGIDVQTVDGALAEALGLGTPRGVLVTRLHPQSPFAAAGLAPGDVILTLGGRPVDGPEELAFRMATLGSGAAVVLAYIHDGGERSVTVALGPAPDSPDRAPVRLTTRNALGGLAAVNINPAVIDTLNLPLDASGVAVVEAEGYARRTGLRPGDIILQINGRRIATTADLADVAEAGFAGWEIVFERGGRRSLVRLRDR